jgi:ribonuclease HI
VFHGRAIISLSENHYYKFKANLGNGANNLAEFMSAQSLLKLALEKGAHSLQIYEDMMPIIKYKAMNEQYTVLLYKHWQSN